MRHVDRTVGMVKHSAGLMPFVLEDRGDVAVVKVLLVHPGGPFWAKKEFASWSIAKGELESDADDPRAVADREFREELGKAPPPGEWLELGETKQQGGKRVTAWAVEGDVNTAETVSNQFEMEWPPRSGRIRSFPEVDRAEWFELADARLRILKGQVVFLDRLMAIVAKTRGGLVEGEGSTQGPFPGSTA